MFALYAPVIAHLYYLVHVRVVLSGRWVRLWETAGFLWMIFCPCQSHLHCWNSSPFGLVATSVCKFSHTWHNARTLCVCVCVSLLCFALSILSVTLSRWGHLCDVWAWRGGIGPYGLWLDLWCTLWRFVHSLIKQAAACANVAKSNIYKYLLNCLICLWETFTGQLMTFSLSLRRYKSILLTWVKGFCHSWCVVVSFHVLWLQTHLHKV